MNVYIEIKQNKSKKNIRELFLCHIFIGRVCLRKPLLSATINTVKSANQTTANINMTSLQHV